MTFRGGDGANVYLDLNNCNGSENFFAQCVLSLSENSITKNYLIEVMKNAASSLSGISYLHVLIRSVSN